MLLFHVKGRHVVIWRGGPYPHCSPEAPLGTSPFLAPVCVQTSGLRVFLFSMRIKITVWTQKDLLHFSLSHPCRELSQASSAEREQAGCGGCPWGQLTLCLTPWFTTKFCSTLCSSFHPEQRKGHRVPEGGTDLHMKHTVNGITWDMEGIKDSEVLPKTKEHLTLSLKTSLRMHSKINTEILFFPTVLKERRPC